MHKPMCSIDFTVRKRWVVSVWCVVFTLVTIVGFADCARAGELGSSNAATDEVVSSTRKIYFPIVGAGTCAVARVFPSSLSVLDSTAATDDQTGLQFQYTPSRTLTAINNGTAPTSDGDIVIRAEIAGSNNAIELLPDHAGTGVPSETLAYGRTEGVKKSFRLKFVGSSSNGYCDRAFSGACLRPGLTGAPTSKTVRIGLAKAGANLSDTNADYVEVNIVLVDCPPHVTTGGGALSLPTLNFAVVPGDGRVTIVNNSSPPSDPVGIKQAVAFAAPNSSTVTLSGATASVSMDVNGGTQTLGNLQNDTRYCVSLGFVNKGGLVSTDLTWSDTFTNGSVADTARCATPALVDGFLQDNKCFIAEATFGAQDRLRLNTFRAFRDQFLIETTIGRALILKYYTYGPLWAQIIRENPLLKKISYYALSCVESVLSWFGY